VITARRSFKTDLANIGRIRAVDWPRSFETVDATARLLTGVTVRFNQENLARLDAWRRAHRDPPSRGRAVELLMDHALEELVSEELVSETRAAPQLPPLKKRAPRPSRRLAQEGVALTEATQ
jgi:hypothetical protein